MHILTESGKQEKIAGKRYGEISKVQKSSKVQGKKFGSLKSLNFKFNSNPFLQPRFETLQIYSGLAPLQCTSTIAQCKLTMHAAILPRVKLHTITLWLTYEEVEHHIFITTSSSSTSTFTSPSRQHQNHIYTHQHHIVHTTSRHSTSTSHHHHIKSHQIASHQHHIINKT